MAVGTRAPSTIITVPLTGQTDFTIPFEYLARKFVVLTLLGIDRQVLVLNADYRFVSKTVVSLTIVPGGQYTSLEIRRVTSASERLVDFHDGSILRAADMNLSQVQTLHVAEEARDLTADTIGVNDEGHLDARGRKMVNLVNGENPLDAVNLGQLRQYDNSTLNNADRSEAARDVALAAERGAVAAKDEATRQAAAALQSEEHARVSKENAEAAERKAAQHVHDSGSNANIAADAANHALQYQDTATVEANRARDEADRAKTEADKLTNWNDLAGTIDTVFDTQVRWKGPHYFMNEVVLTHPQTPGAGFASVSNTWDGTHQNMVFNVKHPSGNWASPLAIRQTANSAAWLDIGTNVNAYGNIRVQAQLNGCFQGNKSAYLTAGADGLDGAPGALTSSVNLDYYQAYTLLGASRGSSDNIAGALWRIKPSSQSAQFYDVWLKEDGLFEVPHGIRCANSGTMFLSDGNITGSAWAGRDLSSFLSGTYATHIRIINNTQYAVWRSPGFGAGYGLVATATQNSNSDDLVDIVSAGNLQWVRGDGYVGNAY